MSKTEPDPLAKESKMASKVSSKAQKLQCHVIFGSLDWHNCEFDLESDIEKISDLFAATMLIDINRNFEYSLLLTQDEKIKDLNHKYRNKNSPTDVLSFPQFHLSGADFGTLKQAIEQAEIPSIKTSDVSRETSDVAVMLGDVAISWGTFRKDLISLGLNARDHFAHLLVHSLLHLIGYDHIDDSDEKAMMEQEIKILANLSIENPYKL